MAPTPRSGSLGAAELTQKFKKETEKLVSASSRTEPWVLLQPRRLQWSPSVETVLKIDTNLGSAASTLVNKEHGSLSPTERPIISKKIKNSGEHQNVPGFNADSFLKLHALCSSSSSSIEMIRM